MKLNSIGKKERNQLSDRIKMLRNDLNLSIQEMSDLLGYSKTHYSHIEEGTLIPSNMFLERICKETGANWMWLETGEGFKGTLQTAKNYREIAERIRTLRLELKLTQMEFAKKTGISQSAISRIEIYAQGDKGEILVTKRQLEGICNGCNVGYDWLVFGYEEAKENPCNETMIKFLNRHPELRSEIRRIVDSE